MDDTELNKRTRRFFFDDDGYWTAWTTTTTTLASQWGLLINIDSATGDIARTTSGFIEDEKHWVSVATFTSTLSSKFTSSTPYGFSGDKCIYSNVTVVPPATFCRPIEINYLKATWTFKSPLKPSTKYRIKIPVYTNTTYTSWLGIRLITSTYTSADAYVADIVIGQLQASGILNKIYVSEFTTWATVWLLSQIYARFESGIVGEIAIDLNSMTLEEVVEPVANSLVTPSPSLVSFTAVGSTDNIDQSMLTINGSTALWNGTRNFWYQQFLPRKSKLTSIVTQKSFNSWTFVWNILVKIRNNSAWSPWSTVLASYTIPNATWNGLSANTDYVVPVPCNLTVDWSTTYWIEISSTTSDAVNYTNLNVNSWKIYTDWISRYSATDLSWFVTYTWDLYFKTLYYKPTTNFKASQNNLSVSVSADEDGFLEAGKIGITTWRYTFDIRDVTAVSWTKFWYIFYKTTTSWVWWETFVFSSPEYQLHNSLTTYAEWIMKIEIPWWVTDTVINAYLRRAWASYSTDDVTYTPMYDNTWSSTPYSLSYTIPWNVTTLYIKLFSYTGWLGCYFADSTHPFTISATVDVSSYSTLKNYPTNKDLIKQYATTLSGATTSATYRATKWGFPAIEYSATEYQFLDVDTTATGSTVAFSELGTTYTTVADGDSLAISSTSNPNIFVKANITANRLYSSSNDYNASSDKDGSMRETVVYQVVQ